MSMNKLVSVSGIVLLLAGIVMIIGGIAGVIFTYSSVKSENIVTPEDASISARPVRGPLTLKAQADIIRTHMLRMSDGKTYGEMPRQIQKLDDSGNVILNDDGSPMMIPNATRDTWITATTLITALNLGIMAYAMFSGMIVLGLLFGLIGIGFLALSKRG